MRLSAVLTADYPHRFDLNHSTIKNIHISCLLGARHIFQFFQTVFWFLHYRVHGIKTTAPACLTPLYSSQLV